jgi:hypothetical protein
MADDKGGLFFFRVGISAWRHGAMKPREYLRGVNLKINKNTGLARS